MGNERGIKTEHAGAKNGGGFGGTRTEAKRMSNRARREADKVEAGDDQRLFKPKVIRRASPESNGAREAKGTAQGGGGIEALSEPVEMKFWRELIAVRDELVAEARRWSAVEHPIRRMDHVASALAGLPPASDRPDWSGTYARQRAKKALKLLAELDKWIEDSGRAKGNDGRRGRTLQQLEAQVRKVAWRGTQERAEAAIVEWLRDREDLEKRQRAADAAWRYYTVSPDTHPVGNEEQRTARLEAAEGAARATRIDQKATHERRAKAILKLWGNPLQ